MVTVTQGFLRPTTTPTPDEVFDVWLAKLSGAELKVLLYVVRRTFGFKKDCDAISLNQICSGITTRDGRVLDHGTGLARNTAARAVKRLEELGLIVVERGQDARGGHEANTYRLRFRALDEHTPEETGVEVNPGDGGGSKSEPGVVTKSNQGSSKRQPPLVRKSHPQQTGGQQTGGQQTASRPASTGSTAPPPPERAPASQETHSGGASPAGGAGGAPSLQVVPRSPAHGVSPPPPPSESEEAARLLVEFGVWRSRARQAARRYNLTPQLVRRARDALAQEIAGGARFANPAAILLRRLEAGWEPPEAQQQGAFPLEYLDAGFEDPELQPAPEEPERKPLSAIVDAQGRSHDAHAWFREAQAELRLQLPRETFDTWLRDAEVDDYRPPDGDTPGALVIRLPNITAREWVEQRLHRAIRRTVDRMLGCPIDITYTGPEARSGPDPPVGLIGQAVLQSSHPSVAQ